MSQAAMDWDLTSYFPAFDDPSMQQFKEELKRDLNSLIQQASTLAPLDTSNADSWQDIFLACEKITDRLSHLGSYIGCLSAADAPVSYTHLTLPTIYSV